MATLWTTPRTWITKDAVTKDRLNDISNQLRYLYNPSSGIVTVRGTASDVAITSLTPVAIDDPTFQVSVETTGRALKVKMHLTIANNTLGSFHNLDVLMDGTTYLSSLTTTQLTNGLWRQRQFVAAYQQACDIDIIVPAGSISAAVHTFTPRIWVSGGTTTVFLSAGYFSQFYVGE